MRETICKRRSFVALKRRVTRYERSGLAEIQARRPMRYVAGLLALTGALLASDPAAADTPPAGAAADARADEARVQGGNIDNAFQLGIEHYAAGRYEQAEAQFLRIWRVQRTYDVAANLGHTEFNLGKMVEAATHLSFALKNWPLVGKEETREKAENRLAEAKAKVGTLLIRVSVSRAEILIDGKRVGEAPLGTEVFVGAGAHRIEAKLVGYEPLAETVEIKNGASREVRLTMRPVERERPVERDGGKSTALLVGGTAASVALVGAGVGLFVAGSLKKDEAEAISAEMPSTTTICASATPHEKCADLKSTSHTSEALRSWGIAGIAVGSAVGIGTIVYWQWPASRPEQRVGVRLAPVLGPAGAGMRVTGSF